MAPTVTVMKQDVSADRIVHLKVVMDDTSGSVSTGLSYVDNVAVACSSAATGIAKFYLNLASASGGTASYGNIYVGSATAGTYYLTVFGH